MARTNKDKRVRIRILPLHGIGGVGDAGDTAWMTKAEADDWVAQGYVEILPDADEPVPSTAADADSVEEQQLELTEEESSDDDSSSNQEEEAEVEDHKIMKPETKRK